MAKIEQGWQQNQPIVADVAKWAALAALIIFTDGAGLLAAA